MHTHRGVNCLEVIARSGVVVSSPAGICSFDLQGPWFDFHFVNVLLKCVATLLLLAELGAVGWAMSHMLKIKRELIADEALPKRAQRANIVVLITTVLLAFSALLVAFLLR
jgi:hypothetical protein